MKIFVFVLLILPGILFADGGLPNQPYIYVVGWAGIEKPADIVTLRFELVARAPDQVKANEEVQAKAAKIFALLKDRKIASNDVIAEDIRSEADFEQGEGYRNRGKLIGYVVNRSFAVRVREVPTFPKLVDELVAIGDVEFGGIEPGLSKAKEMEDQLWDRRWRIRESERRKHLNKQG